MFDALFDDGLNPKFVHYSPVHVDELGSRQIVPRTRFAAHVDEAIAAWQSNLLDKSEQCRSVRDLSIELLTPLTAPTTMRIDIWVAQLDAKSCVYGFLCSSENGSVAYARGERTLTRLDGTWSAPFRSTHAALRKELPAYA